MSEATGLSIVIEAKNALAVFTQPDHIESILQQVEKEVNSFVPDVSTKKGRDAIASLGLKVAKTKTYLDGLGKDLVTEYKEVPNKIDASRKTVRDRLDALKEKVLLPKLEYEAEQERIAAEAAYAAMWQEAHEMDASITAERLVKKESDHEMALLMNDAFDRDAKAKADEIERLRKAHEEFIVQQAAEKAKREVEEKAKRDIEAAEQRERDAKLAQERAEQTAKDAAAKAERDAKELAERVEREKQDAIAAEKLKAQQEADRVQREAKQKEDARLAEEKRVADEAAKKAADKAHQAEVNNKAIAVLTSAGIDAECAKACVVAIIKNQVSQSLLNQQPPIQINY
ncbi:TPA: cell envelope biogenesis protein TolA [Yersinia enterocolitica]|nr:cell envelope biogenesis protein TolA [Yersinia enterocolitica]HEF8856181.1 cell envelope biogenesis protein TolA [Yersinia enterocolitica]HEN3229525.1 cell envelope biogenesis protein TolA [Yersinia enterocolitica]HEN3381718.1 cell envelope biogenesis protein TolA [Yersinia enterocolitica]HEN3528190.1 cell envelope biogenesis protein TolA [Yersinia enterocolitica]